jgi:CRP-like cAMP-binding protein
MSYAIVSNMNSRVESQSNFKHVLQRFSLIPESEWAYFSEFLSDRFLKKGQKFISAGDPSVELAFVVKGLFRVYYTTHQGAEFIRNFHAENDFMGPYSTALINKPSNVDIEALEDSHIVIFRFNHIRTLYGRHSCWQEIGRKVAEGHYISREKREFELLCYDAKKRHDCFLEDFGKIKKRLSQAHIAGYLGITPVSFSRLLKEERN